MTPRGFLSAVSGVFPSGFLGVGVAAAPGAGGESFSKENAGMIFLVPRRGMVVTEELIGQAEEEESGML